MGLGILEDRYLSKPPGTHTLGEAEAALRDVGKWGAFCGSISNLYFDLPIHELHRYCWSEKEWKHYSPASAKRQPE
jgi:hypothetical protein